MLMDGIIIMVGNCLLMILMLLVLLLNLVELGGGVLQSPVDASGSNYIAISPDTDYLLTFWYKSTTSNILLTVGGCCAEGTYGTQQLIGTGDWVKIELIFTTDEDPGIFVQLYQNITDETLAYVDEMFLEVYVPEEPPTENETLESIDNKLTDILTNTDNIDDNINILVHVVYLFIIVLLASAVWKFYTYIFTVFI